MPRASSRAPKPARSDPSALIFNGVPLVKNDHIYVSAPWEERDGEPYLVARILEILQPSTKALPSTTTSTSNGGGEGTTTSTSSSKASTPNPQPRLNGPEVSRLRLRVNYYFRTRDISNRYVADHRVLVASFHSDVVPAEYVRGVCTVKHREHIEDLDRYKRMPDTFYWHQLYDRYLHRYFDTVPTYKVKNAPAEIVRHLVDDFEFVLCEVGTGAELCDAQRGCCVCSRWAANPESVTCARCARVFHLTCVDPPLAAKPKAGYGWSCAPCSKAHDEEVESYAEAGLGPPPIRKAAEGGRGQFGGYDPKAPQMLSLKGKGKAKEVQEGVRTDARDWHMTNGWPFRYFGMHTNAYNVLDPHDSLFPRARTRLGNKFQCVVPEWDDAKKQQVEAAGEQRVYFQPKRSRASTPMGRGGEGGGGEGKGEKDAGLAPVKKKAKGKQAELLPRGEEEAVNVIWRPSDKFDDATLDELFREAKTLKMYKTAGVDLLNRACQLIVTHEGDVSSTIAALRKVTLSSMGHATWTEEEKRKLVEGAEQHNNDIEEIAAGIPTKKMGDVVKRYYIHIGHNRQEDEATQPEEKVAAATRSVRQAPQPSASTSSSAVTYTSSGRRTRRVARAEADEEADLLAATAAEDDADKADDNGSVCNIPASTPAQRRNRFCAVCGEDESEKWYFCPENISELEVKPNPLVMCESCGIRWRHYGAQYPPYGDELKPLPAPKQPSKKELDRIAAEEAARRKEEEEQAELEAALLKAREPTPPPPKPVIPPKPCLLCKRFEPKTSLFQCDNCTLSVHTSCYGLPEGDWPYEEWLCDLCEREKMRKPLVLHPHCILCPPPVKEEEPKEGPPNPLTALELLKPTGLSNYVHLLCAVWHRELLLGEPSLVSPVEGFTLLPKKRITDTCSICLEKEVGCTVKCEDCDKHFHVACAWSLGYKFAFEIQAVRKKRPPKDVVSVKFKEEEGVILPCIWCPDHHFSHSERKTYDIGARDQATKLTALQMYVRTTKAPKNPDAPLPLRLGRRLDTLVEPVLKPKEPTPPPPPPRRKPRASLLTAIIEELPPPGSRAAAAKSAPRKGRRTQSMTPMQDLVYEPPELPQYFTPPGQQPEPDQDMSMDQDVHLAMLDEVASTPAEDAPLPAKRVRKQPKRFEPESPQTKPKGSKKRRTGSYAPNDRLSSTNGYYDESSLPLSEYNVDPANFGQHLPPLPASSSSLPSLPVPDLPPLPNFASNLPALPNFGSNQQAGAFADAFYPNDMADAASFLYPSFSGLPSLPQLEQSGGSIDPALEALTAVAAAAAEARLEAPEGAPVIDQTGPTPEEVEAFMQSLPDGPVAAPEPDAEPSNGAAAPEAAQPSPQPQPEPEPVPAPEPEPQPEVKPEPNQQPEPNGIAVPDESEETMDGVDAEVKENGAEGKEVDGEAAENDSEPVERSGETEQVEAPQQEEADQATTSEAPAAEIPATAAPVPASAPPTQNAPPPQPAPSSAAPSSSAAGPTPLPLPLLPSQPDTRHNSPSAASFDGLNVHPILNYVRAHEASSLGRDFRIDTPDDSDAASDRVDSPAPGSGLNSPAAFAQHQALDFAALAGAAAAAAGASSQAGPSHSAVPSTSHGSFAQQQQSTVTPQGKRRRPSVKGQASPAICSNCGTTDSPLFRRDDQGRQLCNSCGLYYKTHGTDRPQKVIARAIGAARVQKRKAQAGTPDDGASTTSAASPSGSGSAYQYKRPKTSGTPLPLMQMPPLSFDASEHLAGGSGSPAQGDGAYLASQGYSSPYGQLPVPPPPPARSSSSTSSAGGGRGSVPPLPRLPPPPPGMAQPQHPAYGALPPLPPSIGNGRPSDPFSLPPLPTPPPLPALPGGTSNGGAAPPLPLPPLQEQQLPPLTGQGQGQGGEGNGALGLFAQAADQAERLRRSGADGEEGGQGGGEEKKRESRGGDEKAA